MYHKKKKMPMGMGGKMDYGMGGKMKYGMGGNMPMLRKKQVPSHAGEQLLGAKVLGGAVGGGLKNLAGQLFDGKKGVDFGQVGKAALGGAAGQVPIVGGMLQNKIAGGGAQAQGQPATPGAMPGAMAPGLPGQQQPGQGLFGMMMQAHGGMVDYSNGGPTPEQLAEASQILANMGKEEKLAKYGMMSDEAILQEIARGLDGGEAAPTPRGAEASADPDYLGSDEQKQDIREAREAVEREEAIRDKGSRSAAQALYDELSQIGMGLRGVDEALERNSREGMYTPDSKYAPRFPDLLGAFRGAYGREEAADRARMESGQSGPLDVYNPLTMAKDFLRGAETDGLGQATVSGERGMEFVREGIKRRGTPVRQAYGGRVKLRKRY